MSDPNYPLATRWDTDDSDNLKKSAGALGLVAILLAIILIVQVVGMVLLSKAGDRMADKANAKSDKIISLLTEIDRDLDQIHGTLAD